MSNPLIGKTIGHYKISEPLGAGGMGVVYRAQDLKLGRMVAVKMLPAGAGATDEANERFKREARTASSLNHPNICTIYGFDEHEGQLYMAMELLEGEPLDRRLSGRPLELNQVLDIATQVCDAMDAAHASGILHRDIKPANIFLTRRGAVKVLDFGLAKLTPDARRSAPHLDAANETIVAEHFTSLAGTTVGTIAYMSPEQARAEEVDPRTDLFSFGVVLYEMVTGRQSFPGNSTAVIFDGILNREPAAPSTIIPSIPPELDRIIAKALEKDRGLRYQTAADLGADLKRLRRDSGSRRIAAAGMASASGSSVMPPAAFGSASATTMVAPAGSDSRRSSGWNATTQTAPPAPRAKRNPVVMVGGLAAIIAVAGAIAYASTAFIAYLDNRGRQDGTVASAASPTDPNTVAAASGAATATPATTAPEAAAPSPEATAPSATTPSSSADKAGAGRGAASPVAPPATPAAEPPSAAKTAAKTGPTPTSSAPASKAADGEAQQRLDIAKAKIANNLNDQALADLRQVVADYGATPAAPEAALLSADLLEKMNRIDDAMAALIEFDSRFASDRRVADSKLRRALLLTRTRQPKAEAMSEALLNDVVKNYPGTPQSLQALNIKLKMDSDRHDHKDVDPVLKKEVPASVMTLRSIIEQFPADPQSVTAYNQLANLYADMNRWADAAQVLEGLGANFPGNPMDVWFRLGELYEKRLNLPVKAKVAYAKVPKDSQKYGDAQRRLKK